MLNNTPNWRDEILQKLQLRNRLQTHTFEDVIAQHNKQFDSIIALKCENLYLSIQNEKLASSRSSSTVDTSHLDEEIQHLKQKLLAQQEELTELHRRKGENAHQIIDLSAQLIDKDRSIVAKDLTIAENRAKITSLQAEVSLFNRNYRELKIMYEDFRDEHQALQLAFNSLEDKLRKAQEENGQLVERLIKYKSKDADRMNEENDTFVRTRNDRIQRQLEEACKDLQTGDILPDEDSDGVTLVAQSCIPTKCTTKFDAHESEVSAAKWSPDDRLLATGGADKMVKLWEISKGSYENKGALADSNAGIMSVDFDSIGTMIIAASNDFACRVWTLADLRLRHTLTGHSAKVMAAKFLGEATKVASGSHDRTLKIWDLRSRSCIETKFVGSSCNDLVTLDSSGSTIISAHYDKNIRFWDIRSATTGAVKNIILNGKITSLDLSRDSNYLLCCVRDDTLKLLDLRMNQVLNTFSCSGFKVGCDWVRATFSPDGQYAAVGSVDGSVFIWGVFTNRLEATLKENSSAVTATSWQPFGTFLASVDRSKKAVIWSHI